MSEQDRSDRRAFILANHPDRGGEDPDDGVDERRAADERADPLDGGQGRLVHGPGLGGGAGRGRGRGSDDGEQGGGDGGDHSGGAHGPIVSTGIWV